MMSQSPTQLSKLEKALCSLIECKAGYKWPLRCHFVSGVRQRACHAPKHSAVILYVASAPYSFHPENAHGSEGKGSFGPAWPKLFNLKLSWKSGLK